LAGHQSGGERRERERERMRRRRRGRDGMREG
jgi:hypothetical protein